MVSRQASRPADIASSFRVRLFGMLPGSAHHEDTLRALAEMMATADDDRGGPAEEDGRNPTIPAGYAHLWQFGMPDLIAFAATSN
jgi:hypothetical protein